ncbi:hypothetical protein AXF42_Ash002389 [Apostasia shenzhenica]|uniref:Uncharacterized protein n=1 Tax=Apostasia shenzhenica TaxID=1088818 RepID=A0A2I0ANL0_9ASPA|nr:hypothetical protein AXF42_Ash002389 [Apostasia shenzhenica]
MAIDETEALPTPSPPSSSSSFHPSSGHHYYVAVDRLQFKMETLVDLLGVAGRRSLLPLVLCCSSRDELDTVYSAVSNLNFISCFPLYSDQAEVERASILETFRQSTMEWNQSVNIHRHEHIEIANGNQKSCMVFVTDACLPFVTSGEAPLAARVLINFELPTKKILHPFSKKRDLLLALLDGIVINMVVGGEVVTLKGLEESIGLIIAEMPISVSFAFSFHFMMIQLLQYLIWYIVVLQISEML